MLAHPQSCAKRRLSRTKRRGTATLELAIAAPLLVLLVAGVMDTCRVMHLQQSLALSAYEGARVAIDRGATTQQVVDRCEQILAIRHVRNASVTIGATVESSSAGDLIAVTVEAPAESNALMMSRYFIGHAVRHTVSMMKEF